jgi:hypothetical protein
VSYGGGDACEGQDDSGDRDLACRDTGDKVHFASLCFR